MEGRDIFRLVDPFSLERNPALAERGFTEAAGGPFYLIIDATDPSFVKIEPGENNLGIKWRNRGIYLGSTHSGDEEILVRTPKGPYDAATGKIEFPLMDNGSNRSLCFRFFGGAIFMAGPLSIRLHP